MTQDTITVFGFIRIQGYRVTGYWATENGVTGDNLLTPS
jgi:hypothetical protein